MSNTSKRTSKADDPRRAFVDTERSALADLLGMTWEPNSMSYGFLRGLTKVSAISDRQSVRLFRLWNETKAKRDGMT